MNLKRALFIRFSAIGDILLITPLIRIFHEHYPQTQIDVLTKKKYIPLLRYHPLVNEIIPFDENPSFFALVDIIKQIRLKKYDIAFDLQKHWRSYFISWFAGFTKVFRYKKYAIHRFFLVYFKKNFYYNTPSHMPNRYFLAFRNLHIEWQQSSLELVVDQTIQNSIDSKFPFGISDFVIGIAPGASRNTKMWPINFFVKLSKLIQKNDLIKFVILGGDEDRLVCKQLDFSENRNIVNWCGETSLLETAAVIKRCNLIICNDSGVMHIATAMGSKVMALFGPTVKEFGFFPFTDNYEVIEHKNLDCRPCSYHGKSTCPQKHFNCMKEITPEHVLQNVKKIIKNHYNVG